MLANSSTNFSISSLAIDRHRVSDPHDELHVERPDDVASAGHFRGAKDHCQVEDFHLGLDPVP